MLRLQWTGFVLVAMVVASAQEWMETTDAGAPRNVDTCFLPPVKAPAEEELGESKESEAQEVAKFAGTHSRQGCQVTCKAEKYKLFASAADNTWFKPSANAVAVRNMEEKARATAWALASLDGGSAADLQKAKVNEASAKVETRVAQESLAREDASRATEDAANLARCPYPMSCDSPTCNFFGAQTVRFSPKNGGTLEQQAFLQKGVVGVPDASVQCNANAFGIKAAADVEYACDTCNLLQLPHYPANSAAVGTLDERPGLPLIASLRSTSKVLIKLRGTDGKTIACKPYSSPSSFPPEQGNLLNCESESPSITLNIAKFYFDGVHITGTDVDFPDEYKKINEMVNRLGTHCGGEGSSCSCVGTVSYGAEGAFTTKNSVSSVGCNNQVFGDPIPGTKKDCYCSVSNKLYKKIDLKKKIKSLADIHDIFAADVEKKFSFLLKTQQGHEILSRDFTDKPPPPPPSPPTPAPAWDADRKARDPTYMGCFKDCNGRDLPINKGHGNKQQCLAACAGYKFMGHQWAGECWCGNDYGKQGEVTEKPFCECDAPNIGGCKQCVYKVPPPPPSRKLLEVAKTEATAASPKGKCWCGHDSLAMKEALKGDIEAESAPQICTFMTSPLADAAMIASQKDAIAEIASAKTRVARANFGVVTATAKQLEAAKSVAQTANENLNIVETEATANNKEDISLTPESIAVNANVQKENARLASLKGKLYQLEIETSKMRGKVIAINGLMRENQVIKKEVVLSQDAILPKLADAEVP